MNKSFKKKPPNGDMIVHVVPHTHWDREWYLSYQNFRIRLVRLMDRLQYLLENKNYPSFHFDGQTIILEDYLEIKPANKEILKKLITEEKIDVGPWYVMPDEFLVSGESIIRNLEMGLSMADEFGRGVKLGYLPDIFGHISQMPQLLQGFGIDNIVFWRGIDGGAEGTEQKSSEFIWQGADGSKLLANHLPIHAGYSNALSLPSAKEEMLERIKTELDKLTVRNTTKHLLLMNGTDHTMPEENLVEMVEWMNEHFEGFTFIHSTVDQYVQAVKGEAHREELQSLQGELRSTNYSPLGHHNFVLANVMSTRMYLKMQNERAQVMLERWAEPLSVWSSRIGGVDYPYELLRQSWKYLLQNHPHDSICGCSIDEVHDQNETRFEWSSEISTQLAYEAMHGISAQINTEGLDESAVPIHVFHTGLQDGEGMVEADILFPDGEEIRNLELRGIDGALIPSQVLESRKRAVAKHAYDHHPLIPYWQAAKVRFYMPYVPAQGYTTILARPTRRSKVWDNSLITRPRTMENEWIKVDIRSDGTFDLTDKHSGRVYPGQHTLEDGGDRGDGYVYSPPLYDEVFVGGGEECAISVIADTPDFAIIRISRSMLLPLSLTGDRNARTKEKNRVSVETEVTLLRHTRRVEIRTTVVNSVKDHRLRVLFPTNVQTDQSRAGSQFDVVKRKVFVQQPNDEVWVEDAPTTYPMHGFVDVSENGKGFALLSGDLTEYEICSDSARTLALTLLRSVGHLGSPDPLKINAGAGPALETPGSQCLRSMTYNYAIVIHEGISDSELVRQADAYRAGLRYYQGTPGKQGKLPVEACSFLRLTEGNLSLSALKRAEDGKGWIVRLYNPASEAQKAVLTFKDPIAQAAMTNLQERQSESIQHAGKHITVTFEPKQIRSIRFSFAGE
ncbi:mannosylglycerate hydrolase [Paenibacillus taihuensis]|uniref:Mannosylglycerate hydrolase n=1 Tax=Paenibacillus taihuensis TaxID=1156355 RepID=A0A3D9RNY3_9BACL|nr:glycoside hydrolase family 38 C-terminal domain-containing protein [Paenibacillus taihuensis]REE77702.1 mannosylglycerate hydrolase [Paenibacillus taihuensis]